MRILLSALAAGLSAALVTVLWMFVGHRPPPTVVPAAAAAGSAMLASSFFKQKKPGA